MLSHETYRVRLDEGGLSFLEFSYQLLQAYDFLHLFRTSECAFQVGGSDQWANILAGVDLIRRVESAEAFALVWPLVTTASGAKMGKTAEGAVWLDPDLCPPYEYYQFWINTEDDDVERFLALFTFLPMEEVRRLGGLAGADLRQAKQVLAFEATSIVHGREAAEQARDASSALFRGEGDLASAPAVELPRSAFAEGVSVVDLVVTVGLYPSKREARRQIAEGGLTVDGTRVASVDDRVTGETLNGREALLLRAGKKRFLQVRLIG
jgi:tyrosyl-tRNA synthetase